MFSIHRKLFLVLKKIRIVKITPPQVLLTAIWKTLTMRAVEQLDLLFF